MQSTPTPKTSRYSQATPLLCPTTNRQPSPQDTPPRRDKPEKEKHRSKKEKHHRERARTKKRRRHASPDRPDNDEDADEDADVGLAGARVAHVAEDLAEGGAMVLTLADEHILDDKGQLREEADVRLENVNVVRRLGCVLHAATVDLWQG